MEQKDIQTWSSILSEARTLARPIAQISNQVPAFPRRAAYQIQELGLKFRESLGEKLIGYKMGLTSEAKRKQMNLDSPLYGILTDKMQVENLGVFQLAGSIHPKIEPEIAFWIKKDLGNNPSRQEVLEATHAICSCLEILDSRYQQFKYFSMEDVISDNSSSSHFVLGPWLTEFHNLDLTNLNMKMWVNDQLAHEGNSKDISGDPVQSVIELCQLLSQNGQTLKAGSVILAGAATAAVSLEENMQIKLTVEQLPEALVHTKRN